MTRKKKHPPQNKHHQITDSSGWTHIIKGLKGSMATIRELTNEPPIMSLEAYANLFRTVYRPHWQASACLQSLTRVFEEKILSADHLTITKVVCLGLGSLTTGGLTPSYEFAALLSILELLGKCFGLRLKP